MALKQNEIALGKVMMPELNDSGPSVKRMRYTITADLAANDIIELGSLPADAVPVDAIMDHPAMGVSSTASFGLLNAGKTDLDGTPWIAAADVAAAGAARADDAGLRAMAVLAPSDANRPVGIKIVADSTITDGEIAVTLIYRSRD